MLERPAGRYLQLAAILKTANPLETPRLKQIVIDATPQRPKDWTKEIRVIEFQNEEIVRTSIPFAYERFDHPRFRKLRQEFQLDEVARGVERIPTCPGHRR